MRAQATYWCPLCQADQKTGERPFCPLSSYLYIPVISALNKYRSYYVYIVPLYNLRCYLYHCSRHTFFCPTQDGVVSFGTIQPRLSKMLHSLSTPQCTISNHQTLQQTVFSTPDKGHQLEQCQSTHRPSSLLSGLLTTLIFTITHHPYFFSSYINSNSRRKSPRTHRQNDHGLITNQSHSGRRPQTRTS